MTRKARSFGAGVGLPDPPNNSTMGCPPGRAPRFGMERRAASTASAKRRRRMAYDLVIKNGVVIDGSGLPRFRADVGIQDGLIAEVGYIPAGARRVIDASGLIVAPGI